MKKSFVLLFLLFSVAAAHAQLGFKYNPFAQVKINGDTLANPWAGGLNYAQFSHLDFNRDGFDDLLVFDRSSNQIQVFLKSFQNGNPYYRYQYKAEINLPDNLRYRLATYDYDNDGDLDLFTYGIGGVRVYKNTSTGNQLSFELFKSELESMYNGGPATLFVSSSDIPALVDVDHDGDMDILTFSNSGGTIEYHKNLSKEIYGIPDSLQFEIYNECWGRFEEGVTDNSITLNSTNPPCDGTTWVSNPQRGNRHSGSTVLAIDIDNSGVYDLVLGDVSHENLVLVTNGGTAVNQNSAMTSFDLNFPSNTTPANLQIFPAAYYLDVNHDGVKDLVVGANAKGSSQNKNSVLFYENLGTNSTPNFIYRTDAFLQRDMLDNGVGGHPVLVDLNGDGLLDLILANFYRYKDLLDKESAIQYYQNTGTANQPEFTLITEDWNNFANSNFGLRIHPTFGDMDNDGDMDMFIGSELGNLHYYENTGTSTNPVFNTPQVNITDATGTIIDEDAYVSPQLFDLNDDDLLDLIIGRKDGTLAYYQNTGTASNYQFTLSNANLGNVNVNLGSSDGFATPHFINKNDTLYLFCGSRSGRLWVYDDIADNLNQGASFNLISDDYLSIDAKAYSSVAIAELNNNTFLDLLYGHDLGGAWLFEADPNITYGITKNEIPPLMIYPNPSEGSLHIEGNFSPQNTLQIYDSQGRLRLQLENIHSGKALSFYDLEKGVYHISLIDAQTGVVYRNKVIFH
ncbi:Por secretion system C-terminal sorting domain-containing protein [Lishizhenia tianjinensis]|uniref:Por secretion system C-terminal sorting domain-containing protein n=1 Tax=Lishizhenia tianjinensis TaxID=477690 RepID=A0A1I7AR59_9FLAO|nr:T9SS type A sorting domain-containing protein [Lishizhenia tianjinensis]SFT77429.1 Por secretion system C-terminal sorting domain-containing protein [Lishizhenia tianjinensis]